MHLTQRGWGLKHQPFWISPDIGVQSSKVWFAPIDMKNMDIFQDAFFVSLQHLKFRGKHCTNLQYFFDNPDIQHVCRIPMEVLWLSPESAMTQALRANHQKQSGAQRVLALQNGSSLKGILGLPWEHPEMSGSVWILQEFLP